MEKRKNKGKKIVLLVCGILLALAVIAGGAAAVLFMNDGSTSEEAEYSGEVHIQDEQALRAALKSEDDCQIVLSEDIVITKELEVFGDKKLSGGSIIMDMRREGSGESVLAIQKGAKLVLDGTTIDGNSVVNCISVKAGGELDSQSGSLVYGYPYGLDVAGKATITDILIDETLHTGVNVSIFGEVDMLGGTISQNVYGIAVAEEARMDIADGVTMTKSVASFIVNYGVMDIRGGKYEGSYDNAIENWGTMSVKGTEGNPVKIIDGKKSGINTKNRATLKAEYVEFINLSWHAMCVEKSGKAELSNIYINKTGKSSLYFNSATVELENATVVGGESYAIYATQNADVTMTNITVKEIKNRAITNERSNVKIDGLTLENVEKNGIYITGKEAKTWINDAAISQTGTSGIGVASGEAIITNSHIDSTKKEGLSVAKDGKASIEDSVIKSNGNFAIGNYGGKVTAQNVQISNTTNVSVKLMNACTFTGNGLTITNAGKQAISVEGGSSATVTNSKIDTTKMAAAYTDKSTLNLKNTTIKNAGSYAIAGKNNGKAVVDQIKIYNSGDHGIASFDSYIVATNIMITDPKRCGVYSEGAEARINMNQIEVYNTGSCAFGFKGAKEITARNVIIENPTNEGIYAFNGANVKQLDNITIKNPGSHGISVEGKAIVNVTVDTNFNPDNKKDNGVTILNPGKVGIRCSNGTVTAKGVTIKNAGAQGISANKESSVIVNGCTIDTTVQGGVYAEDASLNLKNATITGAGTYGVAAKNSGKTLLDNVEVNKSGEHGIGSLNGYIVATNVKVNEPKRSGVYSEGEEAVINMNQVEVYNTGSCGFGFKGAKEITARNVIIENPTNEGIYAFEGANVKKLDNITIKDPGSHGVSVEGNATVNIIADTSFNPENTTGNGVSVINAETHGIRVKGATLTAAGATVTNAKLHGIYAEADAKITLKKSAIASPGRHGIAILASASAGISETTITNAGERGLYNEGKLTLTSAQAGQIALTIDTTADHGIYLGAKANVEGSGLTIKNTGNNGIFSEGADMNISNVNMENITSQGVQLKNGTVAISGINFKEVGQAVVYVRNNTKLTLEDGVIQSYSYGLAATDSAEVTVKNVTVEKGTKNGAYSTNALINAEKNSKVDLRSGTKIDGKNVTGDGVNVVTSTTSVVLNGASFANIADGNAAVYLKGSNTTIKLQKALTEAVSLKPNTYNSGLLVAEKAAGISDADFETSMALLVPVDTDWRVNNAGCLSKPGDVVATIGNATYTSLEEAFAAANAAAGQQTIVLLKDATVTGTITVNNNITLTSEGARTISGNGRMFKVAAGKSLTVTGTDSAKIAFTNSATSSNKEVFYNEGTLNLTDVTVSGGYYAVNNRSGSTLNLTDVTIEETANNGMHLAGGTTTVTNVTISKAKGHGIGCYAELVLKPAAEGQTALTIHTTTKNGIYASYDSVITGSGLSIENTTTAGIAGDYDNTNSKNGITVNLSDVTIKNTGTTGIQVKFGNVTISDFIINGTAQPAVKATNSYGVNFVLSNGTITTDTYSLMLDNSAQGAVLTDVTITGTNTAVKLENSAKITVNSKLTSAVSVELNAYAEGTQVAEKGDGISDDDFAASMALLIPVDANWVVDGNGKLAKASCEHVWSEEITSQPTCSAEGVKTYTCSSCGSSYTEPVAKLPHTVTHVAYVAPSLEAAGNIEYWYCTVCSTAWKDEARTQTISLTDVVLPQVAAGNVAYMNGTAYTTVEAAVTAANGAAGADTIYLLCDATVNAQLAITSDITITAAKAVSLQVAEKVSGSVIYGTAGTLTITGASEDAKITIAASTKSQSMVKLNGGNAVLTNVQLKGNTSSTVTVANGNCVQIEVGTLTAKNVTLTDCKGDGIRVYAGATANVDNVTISGAGKYGVNILGTLNIYNTAHADHALSVNNTVDHGIRVEGTAQSHLNNVPAGTYAIKAENNKGRGIVVTNGGSINLSHVSVTNSGDCGVEFIGASFGSLSDFAINGTGKSALKKATGAVTLANGSIITANCCIETSDSNLTATNVTVQRTTEGDALSINGATSHEGITVITEEQNG